MKKSAKLKEGASKKPLTSKSRKASGSIVMATEQVYQVALKSIISSIVPHCPKEILVEILKFINIIYPKLKDPCLNSVIENDTVKRRELVWKNVTSKVQDVLFPLMQATNTEQKLLLQVPESEVSNDVIMADSAKIKEINTTSSGHILNHAIKSYAQCRSAECQADQKKNSQIYWPKPLEINFLQIKDADDVATISCRVGDVTIPYAMIDSGQTHL
jgi:hypothetical protein